MVVNPTTEAEKTKPYIMIQNMMRKVVNYTQCDICSFAVYAAECKTIFHPCKRMPLYFLWLISVFALQFLFFPWLVDPLLRLF